MLFFLIFLGIIGLIISCCSERIEPFVISLLAGCFLGAVVGIFGRAGWQGFWCEFWDGF